uniref:Conserved domain protein n=1 Tax=Rhabditophanes sp. KR3021 TaxID=114890 RepID=A0AC35UB27_9BILA
MFPNKKNTLFDSKKNYDTYQKEENILKPGDPYFDSLADCRNQVREKTRHMVESAEERNMKDSKKKELN